MITLERVIALTAFCIAATAAFFSITGIGKLFAGAAISAMVMAGALELGKLVGISFLYRYWKEIPKALKSYMAVASIVLIAITSAGIYGYLSSAYAKVAADPLKMNAEVQILNSQAQTLDEEIQRKTQRLDQIISLRGQQENRIDNLISKSTTGSNTTIRSAQNSLTELNRSATTLQQEINRASAQRDSLKAKSLTTDVAISTNSDIGTFVYISRAIGVELDTVVKWFILVIVLVFDPLSICLVLAYNFLKKNNSDVPKDSSIKNNKNIEPELPLYVSTVEDAKETPSLVINEEVKNTIENVVSEITSSELHPTVSGSKTYDEIYNEELPYYMESKYNWNKDDRWATDANAIAFKKYLDSRNR